MKKKELNNGAVVITRQGDKYLKLDDNTLLSIRMDGAYITLKNFNDNLEHTAANCMDIIKVYNRTSNGYGGSNYAVYSNYVENEPTWERPKDILDDKEREYLSAVIKPFRDRVLNICKNEFSVREKHYIRIAVNRGEYYDVIRLPEFEANTMYKGMKANRVYTLEELEL